MYIQSLGDRDILRSETLFIIQEDNSHILLKS